MSGRHWADAVRCGQRHWIETAKDGEGRAQLDASKGFRILRHLCSNSQRRRRMSVFMSSQDGVIEVRIRPRKARLSEGQWIVLQKRPTEVMDAFISAAGLDDLVKDQRILDPSPFLCFHILFEGRLEDFKQPFRDLFPKETAFDVRHWDITQVTEVSAQEDKLVLTTSRKRYRPGSSWPRHPEADPIEAWRRSGQRQARRQRDKPQKRKEVALPAHEFAGRLDGPLMADPEDL